MKKSILLLSLIVCILTHGISQNNEESSEIQKYEIFSSKGLKGLKYNGEIVLKAKYSDITKPEKFDELFILKYDDFIKLYFINTKEVLDLELLAFEEKGQPRVGYYYVVVGTRDKYHWGIVDKYGNFILQPVYDEIRTPYETIIFAKDTQKNWKLFDYNGNLIYQTGSSWIMKNNYIIEYRNLKRISSDVVEFNIKIIDSLGAIKFAGPDNYVFTDYSFRNNVDYLIYDSVPNHKMGVLSFPDGESVIYPFYSSLLWFTDELLIGTNNGVMGLINLNDDEVLPFEYDFITPRVKGYGVVKKAKEDIFYIVDSLGQITASLQDYDDIGGNFIKDGVCFVQKDNKWGLVNSDGEKIIPCFYDDYVDFLDDSKENTLNICFLGIREGWNILYTPINKKGEYMQKDTWYSFDRGRDGKVTTPTIFGKDYIIITQGNMYNMIDLTTGEFFSTEWFGPERYTYYNDDKVFMFWTMDNNTTILLNSPEKGWIKMNEKGETSPLN